MYITVNNVEIYYECVGEGKEVLFIPGNGTSFKYMKKLAKLLSEDYKVYLIDRRGQGKSTKNCDLSYDLNIQDIYEFIQQLSTTKPHVIGHSGGAIIAMMLCTKYNDIADKLVLCSGAANLEATNVKYLKRWNVYSKLGIIRPNILNMVLGQKDITESLKQLTSMTLALAGEKDIIKEEHTQTLASVIPNAKLKIYTGENHSSYITSAKCYKDILDFLNE